MSQVIRKDLPFQSREIINTLKNKINASSPILDVNVNAGVNADVNAASSVFTPTFTSAIHSQSHIQPHPKSNPNPESISRMIMNRNQTGNEEDVDIDVDSIDDNGTVIDSEPDPQYEENGVSEDDAERLKELMTTKKTYKDKMSKINLIKKELTERTKVVDDELGTLMEKFGLEEVIHGANKFILETCTRKKPLNAKEFRTLVGTVIDDDAKVNQVYSMADQMKQIVTSRKVKCLKANSK
jgi:predicted nucleotide-binding protein (sugar kinase/HSP70/actin superfamily)